VAILPWCIIIVLIMSESEWYIYLVRCSDGSLYTGIAVDVARRFKQHCSGTGAKYLRGKGPLKLVLKRKVGDRGLAMRLENRIKRLSRERKEKLLADRKLVTQIIRKTRNIK
jgi:putative endonuclease